MHQKYGPVVRIMPNVLHVNDPSFVDTLYPQSPLQRRERGQTVLNFFQEHFSVLPTRDHDLHRRRRAILSRFFSQQRVRQLAPVIDRTLSDLFQRLEDWDGTEKPFPINAAYKAATKDVIQAYALGDGDKCLLKDDFNSAFFDTMAPSRLSHIGVHFHWVPALMTKFPASVITMMSPHVLAFIHFLEVRSLSTLLCETFCYSHFGLGPRHQDRGHPSSKDLLRKQDHLPRNPGKRYFRRREVDPTSYRRGHGARHCRSRHNSRDLVISDLPHPQRPIDLHSPSSRTRSCNA